MRLRYSTEGLNCIDGFFPIKMKINHYFFMTKYNASEVDNDEKEVMVVMVQLSLFTLLS